MAIGDEWIEPVTNRRQSDVDRARKYVDSMKRRYETLDDMKGCLNTSDLNRIEGNIKYLSNMIGLSLVSKEWSGNDIPTSSDQERILENVSEIISNISYDGTINIPLSLSTFQNFNELESAIKEVYDYGLVWKENIFGTLRFTGGYLNENGEVEHQTIENYGTSNYFECGNSSRVRVAFTPRYAQDRIVAVCAYDESYAFVGSAIYDVMEHPFPLVETVFIGEIPAGAKYLRYAYLWGKNPYYVPGDVNTTLQLSRR